MRTIHCRLCLNRYTEPACGRGGGVMAQSRQSAKRFSSRWNWDSPTPLAAGECAPRPLIRGGRAHSLAAKGVGESQFQQGDIHCGALYCQASGVSSAVQTLPRPGLNSIRKMKSGRTQCRINHTDNQKNSVILFQHLFYYRGLQTVFNHINAKTCSV